MRAIAATKTRILLVLAMIAAGLMWGTPAASAATVSINLCALPGTATLTGAVTVPIWGFGIPTTPGDCSTATASLPGPQLDVTLSATETTTVTFSVTNSNATQIDKLHAGDEAKDRPAGAPDSSSSTTRG